MSYLKFRRPSTSVPGQEQADLKCRNLLEYLGAQCVFMLEKLYDYPIISLAAYRELPEIARQFVIRMLFVEQPVPMAVVASWTQNIAKEQAASTELLTELNMWCETALPGGLNAWELCSTFRDSLKMALIGGGEPWSISPMFGKDSKPSDIALLDKYAMSRWNCVLHYLVGMGGPTGKILGQEGEGISPDAVRILLRANLLKHEQRGVVTITKQGFQFLLLDTQSQVWHFMLEYLDTCDDHELLLPECLSMLFQLSSSTLGRDYSSEGFNHRMLTFLQHLREFGLVYQRRRKEGRFYPTRLALNITSRQSAAAKISSVSTQDDRKVQESGYIVVETTFRVLAYTDSPLQVAILSLFTKFEFRFPSLVVGVLTRGSVRQALRSGITAKQIVSYLEQYSHPKLNRAESAVKSSSPLPPNVIDQIKLWEMDRNRLTYTEGVVYTQFLSQPDFVTLRDYAQSIKVLVWQNERSRCLVVTKDGHDDVRRFWKRYSRNG